MNIVLRASQRVAANGDKQALQLVPVMAAIGASGECPRKLVENLQDIPVDINPALAVTLTEADALGSSCTCCVRCSRWRP